CHPHPRPGLTRPQPVDGLFTDPSFFAREFSDFMVNSASQLIDENKSMKRELSPSWTGGMGQMDHQDDLSKRQ
ncbi:hypothetical protein ACFL9T_13105, partial [Thermodesulfobacteriota bacterium]